MILSIINAGKLIYSDPRPYWISGEIIPYRCSSNLGNPSGHTMTAAGFASLLWLDY